MATNFPGGPHFLPKGPGQPDRWEFRREDYRSDHQMAQDISFFLRSRSWTFASFAFEFDQAPLPAATRAGARGQPPERISDRYLRPGGHHYASAAPTRTAAARAFGAPDVRSLARVAENLMRWPAGEIGRVHTVTVAQSGGK